MNIGEWSGILLLIGLLYLTNDKIRKTINSIFTKFKNREPKEEQNNKIFRL